MPPRPLSALLCLFLLATGCSSAATPDAESATAEPPAPTPDDGAEAAPPGDDTVPPQTDPAEGSEDSTRIAVQTADGTVFTVLPDGSDSQPLGGPENFNSRPTWSHDAGFIAWASVDPTTGVTAVEASRFDASAAHRAPTVGPVTAIGWDPTSTTVAFLSGVPTGQQLSVVGIVEPTGERPLDTGSPFWFTWAPADQELLVHADGFRIDRLDLEGSTIGLSSETASFQSPAWVDAERALLFADSADGPETLVSTGDEGEGRLPLLTYDGYLRVVANPDTNRVAVQVSERAPEIAEIITASYAQTEPTGPLAVARDRLHVVAVFGGSPLAIDRLPAEAFLWSAAGDTLAYLVRVSEGDDPWYEWRFFGPDGVSTGPLHQLTDTFRTDYLPYFDQLAGDVTFFSPDGLEFVYAGRNLAGDEGIWVHAIGTELPPEKIADGSYATWSPGPAGGQAGSVL